MCGLRIQEAYFRENSGESECFQRGVNMLVRGLKSHQIENQRHE